MLAIEQNLPINKSLPPHFSAEDEAKSKSMTYTSADGISTNYLGKPIQVLGYVQLTNEK